MHPAQVVISEPQVFLYDGVFEAATVPTHYFPPYWFAGHANIFDPVAQAWATGFSLWFYVISFFVYLGIAQLVLVRNGRWDDASHHKGPQGGKGYPDGIGKCFARTKYSDPKIPLASRFFSLAAGAVHKNRERCGHHDEGKRYGAIAFEGHRYGRYGHGERKPPFGRDTS